MMKYRVLLVDDEALIREAIRENIPWEEMGFVLVAACENGREALEHMKQEPPDLLLTDICMPFVDGMELVRYAHEHCPDTKAIIISGYDEFEYAKKAVKYQVMEYILKPITAAELTEVLERARRELDESHSQFQSMRKIYSAYISNLPLLRGRFLNSLLKGTARLDSLQEKCTELGISLKAKYYNTAIVEGDNLSAFLDQYPDVQDELAYFAIYNITQELVEQEQLGLVFQDPEECTVILFCGEGEKALEREISQICRRISQAVREFTQMDTTISIGGAVDSVQKLPQSYEKALAAREYRFLLGGGQILEFCQFPQEHQTSRGVLDVQLWAERTVQVIKTGDREDIRGIVREFAQEIREAYITRNRTILYVQNFMLTIMNKVMLPQEEQAMEMERSIINQIYTYEHLDEMAEDVTKLCFELSRQLNEQRDTFGKKQAIQALAYIDENYGDSQVSLNSVCSHLAVSTSYFSALFKAYTGETFIEALTKKRIGEAKRLLENTSLRAYEVAEKVGYADSHYFSVTFKKLTGKTPKEYAREQR